MIDPTPTLHFRPVLKHAAHRWLTYCAISLLGVGLIWPGVATAFELEDRISNRWSQTASDGTNVGTQGSAITLTWSLAPDGTQVPDLSMPFDVNGDRVYDASGLIGFLDSIRDPASTGGADLTQRAWFPVFQQSFDRLADLSGLAFNYDAADDGVELYRAVSPANPTSYFIGQGGILGVRGDIRIGGQSVDGQIAPDTLAFNFGPNSGEQIIDTDNSNFYSSGGSNPLGFRNVVMHEVFHGLGFGHVESSTAAFLMEPSISTAFDGPQLDDLLLLQRNYGDALEKSNAQAGNDTLANATPLGTLLINDTIAVGQAVNGTGIGGNEVGFVSVDDDSDVDLYEFTLGSLAAVSLDLSPEGATYNQAPQQNPAAAQTSINTVSLSDLGLRVLDAAGVEVAAANLTGAGVGEVIATPLAAGTYYAEVTGADDNVQLYTLGIAVAGIVASVPEPTSFTFLTGLATLVQLRRRR